MLTEADLFHYWRYCLLIEGDLETTAKFVDIQRDNYATFSAEYSKITLLACSEIDVVCRLLCKEIEPSFKERNSNFESYASIILNRFPKIVEFSLTVIYNKFEIKPFEDWKATPYSSPSWWKDYQGIKHSRHINFKKANLINALYSVAGLITLNLYLFRLVSNKAYAKPDQNPKVFDSSYFPGTLLFRGDGLADFES